MIVCSCNLLSDTQVRAAVASGATRPRMSYVYASLGCTVQCGRCVCTIKAFLRGSIDVDDGKSSTPRTDEAAR
jgi:bacterioferritin-associated ferredoxin